MATHTLTLTAQGYEPFELATRHLPTATAEDDTVLLNLPVFAAELPQQTAHIRVRLMLEHAQQLAAQLQPMVGIAERNRRR